MNGKIDLEELKMSTKLLIKNTIKQNKDVCNNKRYKNLHFEELLSSMKSDKFSDNYKLLDKIGEGCFSIVRKCRNRFNNYIYAVKINKKTDDEFFNITKNEFDIMSMFANDKRICKVYELYIENSCIYTVIEYCKGITIENLFKLESNNSSSTRIHSPLKNKILIVKEIIGAVRTLHNKNVIHRDIKYDNIIIDFNCKRSKSCDAIKSNEKINLSNLKNHVFDEKSFNIKLVDFNISRKVKDFNSTLFSLVGTPHFSAPELLEAKMYNNKIDIWSIGILFYYILFKKLPFNGLK